MPFWWRRRRRYWFPYRKNNYARRYRRKRTTRRRYKRRNFRFTRRRRRRRRRGKVRRKKQKITIQQWQPDSIVKCHIKGFDCLVLGAEGKQFFCYTNVKDSWTPPQVPGGGGFGVQQYSLDWLYSEYVFRRNIWTKSNILKDLCRYLRCRITLFRHPSTDFVVAYDRQPPFELDKFTYPGTHPLNLMLQKHKRFVLSKFSKPHGKLTVKLIIKPPKQMLTKWFFTENFSHYSLFLLKAAAINLSYSRLGCCNENQIMSFYYLNTTFYQNGDWGATHSDQWKPYNGAPTTFNLTFWDGKTGTANIEGNGLSYDKGYFQSSLLRAKKINTSTTATAATPINVARYNVNKDNGKGNAIWLMSILTKPYKKPTTDKDLIIEGLPLYMALYGFFQFVTAKKSTPNFLDSYICAIQSPAIEPASQIGTLNWYMPVDKSFIEGNMPYGTKFITQSLKNRWYPNVWTQLETLNTIVECGPFIPKYGQTRESTWELDYKYDFLFKWGGPQLTDPQVTDPADLPKYDVPDTFTKAIQIRNPAKQKAAALLHSWDWRRGFVKERALKRMSQNISTDTDCQPDAEEIPQKKKKITTAHLQCQDQEQEEIQSCLLSLYEEDTFQGPQTTEDLQQLINQHREQQHNLKYSILRLLSDLKDKQRMLQLQTGLLS
nr:MAG: ORF1 [Torque teno midi virus]